MPTYIGETNEHVTNGIQYPVITRDMAGKIFKPGKDEEGHWLDKIGEQDTRIMLWVDAWSNRFYKVYNTGEDVLKEWRIEGNFEHYSPRIRTALSNQLATV